MSRSGVDVPADIREVLLEIWAANECMNQLILDHLDPRVWRARPPGRAGRTIAAIFTHVHNVRRKWLRLSAPHVKLPKELNRADATQKQARAAFAESARRCSEMIAGGLATSPARAGKFCRDGWAPSWPAGPTMVVYMFAHEAHHRGQVLMLSHQLGFPLSDAYAIWNWDKLWKQCGFQSRPR